jgi:hypothetical protein
MRSASPSRHRSRSSSAARAVALEAKTNAAVVRQARGFWTSFFQGVFHEGARTSTLVGWRPEWLLPSSRGLGAAEADQLCRRLPLLSRFVMTSTLARSARLVGRRHLLAPAGAAARLGGSEVFRTAAPGPLREQNTRCPASCSVRLCIIEERSYRIAGSAGAGKRQLRRIS